MVARPTFKNVIMIMTSNAGAFEAAKGGIGFAPDRGSAMSLDAIKRRFSPRVYQSPRCDGRIPQSLDRPLLLQVIRKFVSELEAQLLLKEFHLHGSLSRRHRVAFLTKVMSQPMAPAPSPA